MIKVNCLNPIADCGMDLFTDNYEKTDDFADADAVLVRSAAMHDMELSDKLLCVGRAGAGVNNIPLDKCIRYFHLKLEFLLFLYQIHNF